MSDKAWPKIVSVNVCNILVAVKLGLDLGGVSYSGDIHELISLLSPSNKMVMGGCPPAKE